MTKRHFELVADAVKLARALHGSGIGPNPAPGEVIDTVAKELASALSLSNPRFDRGRFLTACGVDGTKHGR